MFCLENQHFPLLSNGAQMEQWNHIGLQGKQKKPLRTLLKATPQHKIFRIIPLPASQSKPKLRRKDELMKMLP